MILRSLDQLYGRLADDPAYQVAPPGHSVQKISFRVVLKPDGTLLAIEDSRIDRDGKPRPRQIVVPGSSGRSGVGEKPQFLWDKPDYMLGFAPEDQEAARTAKRFEAFKERHLSVEESIGSDAFTAVCRFLERWRPTDAAEHSVLRDAAAGGFGVFKIQGVEGFVHEDPDVALWWRKQAGVEEEADGQCLVTGASAVLARTHGKVRGVQGAQGAGGSLVGFNESAFESHGKTQSYNAPVSKVVAFRYVTALNALLDGPMRDKHRVVLGDTTVAFWTGRPTPTENIFLAFASQGSEVTVAGKTRDEGRRQEIESLLRAIRAGRPGYDELESDADGTPYFILGLSPNSGRVSVRFFHTGTVGELLDNVRRHHADIALTPAPQAGKRRADAEFPGARALLSQAARESKDIPPNLAGPLMRAVILGAPYPVALVNAVIRRIRADRTVNYLRCSVIKGYLTRNSKEEVPMSLDLERTDPAYRLGRLFAALEKTQKDALGGALNNTIRDSFYSSASATPGVVFPRLLRTYQHHLAKLDGGLRIHRERTVQEILEPLNTFPTQLGLQGQGLFALGYYHQTRDLYAKRKDNENE